jgi:Arc/MetJ-type ribon-helix-helix transcriptional regulator
MKFSVSLPAEDVEFLDAYARAQRLASRSSAVHRAVRMLKAAELSGDYEAAWREWTGGDDADAWAATNADGLSSNASG